MMADYRHRRPPAKPKVERSLPRRLFRLTVICAVLVGLAYGGRAAADWLSGSSLFRMERIAVSGLLALPPETIKEAVAVEAGTNLFRIDLEAVEARLVALDRLETVRVKLALPKTLSVMVVERRPLALAILDGKIFEVDRKGRLMETVDDATLPDLPVITGLSRVDFESVAEAGDPLALLLSDIGRLQRNHPWLVDILSDVRVTADGELTAHAHQGGAKVLLGRRLDPVQLGILHTMLRDLPRTPKSPVSIDLRYRKQGILRKS